MRCVDDNDVMQRERAMHTDCRHHARRLGRWMMLVAMIGFVWPCFAGPPFVTDDPGIFPRHTGEAYLFSAGTLSAGGFAFGAYPGVEVNYSALRNTFFHLVVPMAYNDPDHGRSAYGPGDVELGFKWRFLDQADDGVDVAIFPLAELPTGRARQGLGNRRASYILPVWLERDWGPWTMYGGAGRWFMNDPGQRDWWFTGALLQRQLTSALYLGGEVFHETPQTVGGRSSTGFNVGGGYTVDGPWQVLFSAGRNLTDVADNRFSYYLSLYRPF